MLRWQNFNLACAKYGDLANLTRSPPRAQGLLTSVGPYKIPYKILDICGSLGFQKTLDTRYLWHIRFPENTRYLWLIRFPENTRYLWHIRFPENTRHLWDHQFPENTRHPWHKEAQLFLTKMKTKNAKQHFKAIISTENYDESKYRHVYQHNFIVKSAIKNQLGEKLRNMLHLQNE